MKQATYKLRESQVQEVTAVNCKEGTILLNGEWCDSKYVKWDVPTKGTVYGVLLNYIGEMMRLGKMVFEAPYNAPPRAPVLYIKPRNTVTAFGNHIILPKNVKEIRVGAALGIVIGRTMAKIKRAEALDYVLGYTIVNDVSIPHYSIHRPPAFYNARDSFCPIGPWIINKNEVSNVHSLKIRVFINNILQQECNTKDLIRSVQELLEDVTEFMTLQCGDVVMVGVPENAPLVKAHDMVRIEIDEIGFLENFVVEEEE